jgi:putative intracellular protease/amidase
MKRAIHVLNPLRPKRILTLVSNPATSKQTGWPIGFWWGELTHSYWEFTQHGYDVDILSPDGGPVNADSWSDPADASGYSADDLISLGFKKSASHSALLAKTPALSDVDTATYDAVFLVGGQGPMYTFYENEAVHRLVAGFLEEEKVAAVICHATAILLKARDSKGKLLVDGRTWTGFANSEEKFADDYVGKRIQPFWIEDEARKLPNTNFIVSGRFKSFAVRDGHLITGQQQHSSAAAAQLVIEALGV